MFSKLTIILAMAMSLTLVHNASAQTKKADPKAEAKAAAEAKKADEARVAAEKKAEEEKALEAKRLEEAKAAADKAKATDDATFLGYMKSHFSFSYHGEYYAVRRLDQVADDRSNGLPINQDDYDVQDGKIMHNPTVIYRPVPNVKLLVTSEFKYTDAQATAGTFINRHYRSLVILQRDNVLTEKENGIKLDLGIGRRIFDRNHGKASGYGNTRFIMTVGKKFSDKFSTSTLAQYLINDPVYDKITSTTYKHSLNIIPSFTWQITDKLSYFFNDDFSLSSAWKSDTFRSWYIIHDMNVGVVSYQWNDQNSTYFQLKYLHQPGNAFGRHVNVSDQFDYYIGHTYSVTPKLSITPEIGSNIFMAKDGKDFFSEAAKYPEFALYLDWSI